MFAMRASVALSRGLLLAIVAPFIVLTFNLSLLSLVLICSVLVLLSGLSLLSFGLPIEGPLRAVIRGHPTPGGCITLMGNHDIFRHGGQELVPIAGVDAEFEPI